MLKQLSTLLFSGLLMGLGAQGALAETVMEKIARTADLTIGIKLDNVPYTYVNDEDEVVGYSLDIAERIRDVVAAELGKEVSLQIVETKDITEAIPQLQQGKVDLVCSTAFTWERDRYVDFTVSYAVTGMQLLVRNDSNIIDPAAIAGKKIAYVPNTVTEDTIKLVQQQTAGGVEPNLVPVDSLAAGMEAFADGKVDGVAGDGILMDGLRQVYGIKDAKLLSESPPVNYGVGCMVRQGNPTFLRLANFAIIKLAEGYFYGDPEDLALVNKWIGPEGVVSNVNPEALKTFFNFLLVTHEQIPERLQSP